MGFLDRLETEDNPKVLSARRMAEATGFLLYNRYSDALFCVVKAIEADPDNAPAWHEKGRILAQLGKTEESLACYDKAIALRPETAVYYHNKGDTLAIFGEYEEADRYFLKAVSFEPENVVFLTSHARMLAKAEKYAEADLVLKTVCELEPRGPEHWFNRAALLADAGKSGDAFACYKAVIAIAPGHAVSYYNCGNILREQENYEDAVYYYEKALKYDRTMTGAMNNKGLALSCLGRHTEAYDCFRRVLIALPEAPDIWYNQGYELLMLGYPDDAVKAFDTALSYCTDQDTDLSARCREMKERAETCGTQEAGRW
jgi:tetratricopeptide (TPR) repeat protein